MGISGIPQGEPGCYSLSPPGSPADSYAGEVSLAGLPAGTAGRGIEVVNQSDKTWGDTLAGTKLEPLLGEEGMVWRGKGGHGIECNSRGSPGRPLPGFRR